MPSKEFLKAKAAAFKTLRTELYKRDLDGDEMIEHLCLHMTTGLRLLWPEWFEKVPVKQQIPLIVHAVAQLTTRT